MAVVWSPDAETAPDEEAGPRCKQCGARMCHYRLYGYKCSANREHKGIVWPGMQKEETP